MLIEILKRTPSWVFILFFVLVTLGYFQSKERTISRGRVSILPVIMIGLSFSGVLSAFGFASAGIASWLSGSAIAVVFGIFLASPNGVTFSPESQSFSVPGSWLPLALMMALFFTKYVVGVILARHLPVAGELVFVGSISLCYGFFSGLFLARAIVVWRSAHRNYQKHV
ncbi:MAG: hypothetical protein Q8R88_07610 [Desulfoprunum sp.]|nr:hypothetical protein [Desulfoprunum sp.]